MSAHQPSRFAQRTRTLARRIGVGAAVLAFAGAVAPPAMARPIDSGVIDDEFSHVDTNFCDVPGLTVTHSGVVEGRFLFNARKPGTPPYYLERVTATETFTNVEGDRVTTVVGVLSKDHKITDNGDGTLTILVLATGSATMYDASGEVIGRDPGQVRFEILIDHGGTLTDPSDDEFLAFLGVVKESTGRSDDFCTSALSVLG